MEERMDCKFGRAIWLLSYQLFYLFIFYFLIFYLFGCAV